MKNAWILVTITSLVVTTLVISACSGSGSGSPETEGITEEESQQIALDYLLQSPTFLFDGIEDSVELVSTETLRCPYCWTFIYDFDCSHAGYGDRTGQMLAQVITPHEAIITIEEGAVTNAILDQKWDMLTQKLIENPVATDPAGSEIIISCDEFQATNHIERNVTLSVGKSIGVQLCSNPTTGFRWEQPQISDPSIIMVLDRQYQAPPTSDTLIVGAPGNRMMDINAQKAGTCTLSMKYSQSWEGGEKGAWTFTLNITVE